jgi:hypothetical protein
MVIEKNPGAFPLSPMLHPWQTTYESIAWFIEDQAFPLSYDLAPPLPPSPVFKLSLFLSLPVCHWTSLLMGEGGEPNHTTSRKTGPLQIFNTLWTLTLVLTQVSDWYCKLLVPFRKHIAKESAPLADKLSYKLQLNKIKDICDVYGGVGAWIFLFIFCLDGAGKSFRERNEFCNRNPCQSMFQAISCWKDI